MLELPAAVGLREALRELTAADENVRTATNDPELTLLYARRYIEAHERAQDAIAECYRQLR